MSVIGSVLAFLAAVAARPERPEPPDEDDRATQALIRRVMELSQANVALVQRNHELEMERHVLESELAKGDERIERRSVEIQRLQQRLMMYEGAAAQNQQYVFHQPAYPNPLQAFHHPCCTPQRHDALLGISGAQAAIQAAQQVQAEMLARWQAQAAVFDQNNRMLAQSFNYEVEADE